MSDPRGEFLSLFDTDAPLIGVDADANAVVLIHHDERWMCPTLDRVA